MADERKRPPTPPRGIHIEQGEVSGGATGVAIHHHHYYGDTCSTEAGFDEKNTQDRVRAVGRSWQTPLREPLVATPDYVERTALLSDIYLSKHRAWGFAAPSGMGKTTLATQLLGYIRVAEELAFYAEIEPETEFSDVLLGLFLRLRDIGFSLQLGPLMKVDRITEDIVRDAARTLSQLPKRVTLVVDARMGNCSDQFARQLAIFLRSLDGDSLRIISFGKTQLLRCIDGLHQRTTRSQLSFLPGLSVQEFCELATLRGAALEPAQLRVLYEQLTADRPSC